MKIFKTMFIPLACGNGIFDGCFLIKDDFHLLGSWTLLVTALAVIQYYQNIKDEVKNEQTHVS